MPTALHLPENCSFINSKLRIPGCASLASENSDPDTDFRDRLYIISFLQRVRKIELLVMFGYAFKSDSHTSSSGSHVVFLIEIDNACSDSFKAYTISCGHELLSSSFVLFFHLPMVVKVLNTSANFKFVEELSLIAY